MGASEERKQRLQPMLFKFRDGAPYYQWVVWAKLLGLAFAGTIASTSPLVPAAAILTVLIINLFVHLRVKPYDSIKLHREEIKDLSHQIELVVISMIHNTVVGGLRTALDVFQLFLTISSLLRTIHFIWKSFKRAATTMTPRPTDKVAPHGGSQVEDDCELETFE